jgi:hypothetical protein
MTELNPEKVAIGQSSDTMERIALRLIGRTHPDYYQMNGVGKPATHGMEGVCERTTRPLPHGCWDHGGLSPYSMYGDDRWCDPCIAYAALHGSLPKPEIMIEMSVAKKLAGVA